MRQWWLGIFVFFLAACSAATVVTPTPTVLPPATVTPTPVATPTPADWHVKELGSWRVTLNSFRFTESGTVVADLTAESLASKQQQISSLMQFAARNGDGRTLDRTLIDCGNSLDGVVLPGGKLRGELCWKKAHAPVTIFFQAERGGEVTYFILGE